MADVGWWSAPLADHPICGVLDIPGSKSQSNRALVLAALADRPSVINGVLDSRDTRLMVAALEQFGATITRTGNLQLSVTPGPIGKPLAPIDCGLAGTVMRFLPPLAMLADGPTVFIGDAEATSRPMAGLLSALTQLGATVTGDRLPFTVVPPTQFGHFVEIDSSASSQYISGLLLSSARFPSGLVLKHSGPAIPSQPHIEMTVEMLSSHGVEVSHPSPDEWVVYSGTIVGADQRIEPDLTTAAVFLAAAALTEGQVTISGWPTATTQPGAVIVRLLEQFGSTAVQMDQNLTVTGQGVLTAIDVDLSDASELTPVVAGLAAFAKGTTVIRGIGHIRGHETNRLRALTRMLQAVGVEAGETSDGLQILGCAGNLSALRPANLLSSADHRMAHVAALLGLLIPGITVDDIGCTAKTLPDFPKRWRQLVAGER